MLAAHNDDYRTIRKIIFNQHKSKIKHCKNVVEFAAFFESVKVLGNKCPLAKSPKLQSELITRVLPALMEFDEHNRLSFIKVNEVHKHPRAIHALARAAYCVCGYGTTISLRMGRNDSNRVRY